MWILILSIFSLVSLQACTGIRMTALDGSTVNGRTLEFGTPVEAYACMIPRNYSFIGKTPLGNGLRYVSKYSVLGAYCFTDQVVMDGINEMGLACGAFYFPGYASYTELSENNQARALSPVEFPNWILTQFASLAEVKEALQRIVIVPTVTLGWGNTPPPFHYVVYDKRGNSLVIEPLNGTLVVHENKLGVITNSPTFDWHITNLRNYINLSPFNVKPVNVQGVELAPLGQGSGLLGMPGDFTPPSRFVRAAIFSTTAFPVSKDDLVFQAFHILNQFDIPKGVARENDQTADFTLMTSVKDPNNLRYYFRSYDDQTVKWIGLSDFDWESAKIKSIPIQGKNSAVNVSQTLR